MNVKNVSSLGSVDFVRSRGNEVPKVHAKDEAVQLPKNISLHVWMATCSAPTNQTEQPQRDRGHKAYPRLFSVIILKLILNQAAQAMWLLQHLTDSTHTEGQSCAPTCFKATREGFSIVRRTSRPPSNLVIWPGGCSINLQ